MGFVKCKGAKAAITLPSSFENIKDDFLGRVQTVVEKHKIPPSMIVNFGLSIIPVKDWTMEQQGAKQVQIHGVNNKRQATGTFLPPQLIHQRKRDSCHSSFKFPKDWNIIHSKNHWTTVNTIVIYTENILGLYFEDQREKLNLQLAQKGLVLLDAFKVHQTEAYADEVTSQLNSGKPVDNINVDLKLSIVKPLHAKWVLSSFDCTSKHKNILLQGWKDTGIPNFVQNKKDDFIECCNTN
uniref:DDE-1 domain-containing protein n=1 Tax=Octopus bimaculoides TaxID=37653 RepID=A0A0L8IGK7_OCTBM